MTKKTGWKKSTLCLLLLALVLLLPAEGQAELPKDYQDFKARYQKEGRTPEGALKLYFEAVFCYIDPATREEGSKMLRYAMRVDRPIEKSQTLATFVERAQDPGENYVFRSFAAGASPENNYKMSPDNFKLVIAKKTQESGYLVFHLKSSGADSPRRVWVKEFDGLWHTINNASTYAQVTPPKSVVDAKKKLHDADFDVEEPKPKAEEKPAPEDPTSPEPEPESDSDSDEGPFLFK
ncbi:MAG: hypothetical protein GX256_02405 [Fretibacterium sp.]|nr:hypothetical protein [Fretibacterium sp.]